MSKDKGICFVGQPFLKQIFKLTEAVNMQSLIKKFKSDRYYKAFKTGTHLLTIIQIWYTLIAQLFLTVIQKMAAVKKAFSLVASLVRIDLISMLDIYGPLRSKRRAYAIQVDGPPGQSQLKFFLKEGCLRAASLM